MNTIKSRFERFASFAFSSADSLDKGADLWDTISHYEFYLTEKGEPNDTLLAKLEELGCSRRWLLYASGEMFAENDRGKLLRYKFMQGIGLTNKTISLTAKAKANILDKQMRPISFDYGIMEKATNIFVVLSAFGWSDVGSWDELYRLSLKDAKNNAIEGDVIAMDSTN